MLDEPTQLAVIRGLQAGDRDAWTTLYDSYSGDVWRYVARLVGPDAAAVADVVQELFLEAAKAAKSFDPARGTIWRWLTGIAHHKVAAYWRQTARAAKWRALAEARGDELGRWLNDGQAGGLALSSASWPTQYAACWRNCRRNMPRCSSQNTWMTRA